MKSEKLKNPAKKQTKKHYKKTQGFFFDMMETAPVGDASDDADAAEPETDTEV